ncbi:MAG: Txe/YoeB family addiction module toxin [Gammaproteobacteria bacterium]|nr:Txe/YoeB family addiction module toxin [Gammaproteobacteria bacterium]
MKLILSEKAWEDYHYWQKADKQILKRINLLIKEIRRGPLEGIGKPEPLKYALSGYGSRRINNEHRIVYKTHQDSLFIAQLRYHH